MQRLLRLHTALRRITALRQALAAPLRTTTRFGRLGMAAPKASITTSATAASAKPNAAAAASAAASDSDAVLIAVGQMNSSADVEANLSAVESLAKSASARGATTLFLPECFAFLGPSPQHSIAMAEPLTGSGAGLMARYCAIAKAHNIWLSLGGFQTKLSNPDVKHTAATTPKASPALNAQHATLNPGGERIYNAHVVVNSAGNVVARYNKIHLFDVNIINGPSLRESAFTAPGSELVVCDSPAGRLGLSVCYDLRFPELYGALSRAGAEILTIPAAFTAPTGVAHWTALLRARAIENQCYVVAAAQTGKHNTTNFAPGSALANVGKAATATAANAPAADGKEKAAPTPRETYGHACIVDPWGAVIAEVSEGPGLAFAEVSRSRIAKVRASIPVQNHRRADLYSTPVIHAKL